jgi:hypothetical protein
MVLDKGDKGRGRKMFAGLSSRAAVAIWGGLSLKGETLCQTSAEMTDRVVRII